MPRSHLIFAALLLVLCGCKPSEPVDPGSQVLSVVATTGMIGDVVTRVAGDHATVEALMGPGVDPHLFKASEADVRRLDAADLVLYNGLHLEGKMGDILEKMGRAKPVVAVAEVVPEDRRLEHDDYEGQYDPHVWFDVSLWALIIEPIVTELGKLDPDHAADFRANGDALRGELEELDAWVSEQVDQLPREQRVLVTAHDAFGYFGARYGFEVVGIQGLSTAAEAGLTDVDRVVDVVVERELKAIFVESSVPQKSIDSVLAGCKARDREVTLGGELFSDAMGAAGTSDGTYVGMVRHNVTTVVEALR